MFGEEVAAALRLHGAVVEEAAPPAARDIDDDRPTVVFVVGAPRSGSSLLEAMLAAHPRVGALGECLFLGEALRPLLESLINEATSPETFLRELRADAAEAAAAVRDRELELFASAYGEVALAKVAHAVRLTDQQALEACRAKGWVFSATSATLKPKAPVPAAPTFDGFEQLNHLTTIVTQLSQA